MAAIASDKNPVFRKILELHTSNGIQKHGEFLVFGHKVIAEILRASPICQLLGTEENLDHSFRTSRAPLIFSNNLFKEIDLFGTRSPILLLPTPAIDACSESFAGSVRVLSALSEPSNLGALLRSCVAFGVQEVVLLKESTSPFHPKAIRASSGSFMHLKFSRGPSLAEINGSDLYKNLAALDLNGSSLRDANLALPLNLLVGTEGPGIPRDLRCQRVNIPIHSKVESLNAAMAASIALYELSSKVSLKMSR